MRVIIVEKRDSADLQMEINNILRYCGPDDIFDIKYSGSGGYGSTYQTNRKTFYSAMIILK